MVASARWEGGCARVTRHRAPSAPACTTPFDPAPRSSARACLPCSAPLLPQDLSLVRHATQQLLALVGPPASERFALHVLRLLCHSRTLEAFHGDATKRSALVAFAQQAARMPGAAEAAQDAVKRLQSA